MPEITDIRRTANGSHRRRLYLDGCEWGAVPSDVVRDLGLRVGQTLEADALEARIAESQPAQAWQRAVRLLHYRERGSAELRRRLLDDGYAETVVEEVVERARDLGFLDDRRFAQGLARDLTLGKKRGRRRVASELASKGVDESLAAEVLEGCCDPKTERERARALAARFAARGLDAPHIASRLVARGFETSLAYTVAREAVQDQDACSDEQ